MSGPDFEKSPLIPAIAQDEATGTVLMLAFMNTESYAETLQTRRVCYWSRSRGRLWRKGEDSGNVQHLKSIYYDCDGDTILVELSRLAERRATKVSRAASLTVDPDTGKATVEANRCSIRKGVANLSQPTCRILRRVR